MKIKTVKLWRPWLGERSFSSYMSDHPTPVDQPARREQILAAVEDVFVRHGFHAASMRDICAAAQMSPGALYRHFPSKETMVEAIVAQERARWVERFEAAAESGGFFEALDYLAADAMDQTAAARLPLWLEIAAEAGRSPRIAEVLREHNEQMTGIITGLAERAAANAELSANAKPREVALFVMSALDGLLLRRATDPEFDFRRSLRASMMLLRQALGARATNARLPRRDAT